MDLQQFASDAHATLNFTLFELAGTEVTLFTILALVLVALFTWQVSRGAQKAVARAARARRMEDQDGSVRVAQRLVHYGILTVGIVVALQGMGIDLGSLVAAGAVFAVGVGLAMQSLAQNFVSGIILLVERSITPGDVVEVDGRTMRVTEMGIRSTVCRTRDGADMIVPNSLLVQSAVQNLTKDDKSIRVRVVVGVTYSSDMAKVRRVLMQAAEGMPWRRPDAPPILVWHAFGASSVDWEIGVWTEDPWRLPDLRTELATVVWDALKANDIVIAFPQLDIHLDPPATEALRLVAQQGN